jgi:ubiquinone/menaquinone biosynthesis C-methylase UbiE
MTLDVVRDLLRQVRHEPEDHFDAAYCAHVIYHIDGDHQDKAIRELIRVTKPGGRIVVIYSNQDFLPSRIARFFFWQTSLVCAPLNLAGSI